MLTTLVAQFNFATLILILYDSRFATPI